MSISNLGKTLFVGVYASGFAYMAYKGFNFLYDYYTEKPKSMTVKNNVKDVI